MPKRIRAGSKLPKKQSRRERSPCLTLADLKERIVIEEPRRLPPAALKLLVKILIDHVDRQVERDLRPRATHDT